MHHIFVRHESVDFSKNIVIVDSKDDFENYNHLANSLRVKNGEHVLCSIVPFESTFDYMTKVEAVDKNEIVLSIEEKMEGAELPIKINLYQGICKSDKLEYIIEKSVELGAYSITPLVVDNSIAKIDKDDKKFKTKMERYNKISKSAAEQSRRHVIPEVREPKTLKETFESIKNDYNIVFYENAEDINYTRNIIHRIKESGLAELAPTSDDSKRLAKSPQVNIFIGPEGGFTELEISKMKEEDFYVLTLGKRILRTETAAVTALSMFMYELEG